MTDDAARLSVEAVFREERSLVLASLVGRYRDLDLAEEVTSDAIESALKHWPVDGVPARPGAWLLTTARHKAVDRLRRDQVLAAHIAVMQVDSDRSGPGAPPTLDADLPDERLQLFFTCAHPALSPDDRLALTLRCLAGLTTAEVARALLIPPATAAQRIVRAKNKIRGASIPFRVPGPDELTERVPMVLQVVYSIFTEGYSASSGSDLIRTDMTDEALRLGRVLHRLLPNEREVSGLLALMLLVDARRDARCGPGGEIVLLGDQDRSLWNADNIDEGCALVVRALTGGAPGEYGIQAAIAAIHDEAKTSEDTDWPQIVALYDVLMSLTANAVVAMNRAVAVAMKDGPEVGLALLDALSDDPQLRRYRPYATAQGDLLERVGRLAEARVAYCRALEFARTRPEKDFLERRIASLGVAIAGGFDAFTPRFRRRR